VLRYWNGAEWTPHLQPVEATPRPDWLTNKTALGIVVGLIVLATIVFVAFGGGGDTSDPAANLDPAEVQSLDADAKADARTAQTAMETYSTDNGGQYAGATAETLQQIEPTLPSTVVVDAQPMGYTVSVSSEAGTTFTVARDPSAVATFSCTPAGTGGCPASGDWSAG
jgi:hypothetical protein